MFGRKRATSERSLLYFQLVEACQQPGCPICTMIQESTLRFLDALIYESVTDPGTRAKLWQSRGFCNWHAWFLAQELLGSAQGIAIIYHDLLSQEIEDLQGLLSRRFPTMQRATLSPAALERYAQRWRQKTQCPVCAWAQWEEQNALELLCHSLGNPVFRVDFSRSAGLCVPHLRQAISLGRSSPHLPLLLEIHLTKYQHLAEELKEFDRKHDYRFAHEPWGQEADSWRRVIEQFVGKREIFGNEVIRFERTEARRGWPHLVRRLWQWIWRKRDRGDADQIV
ncbi:MAG: hypothetical protein D6736_03430 [Nitrospinota bacterium]|nr:MAG: hypothetical protein D6736_03430 [Nitrospinota bacterium]